MRATIVVPDGLVIVDGRKARLDLSGFGLDIVHAVQAWTDKDRAEVEFKAIDPDGDGPLPSVKPPNKIIDAQTFDEWFGPVIEAFHAMPEPPPRPQSELVDIVAPVAVTDLEERNQILSARIERLEQIIEAIGKESKEVAAGDI